MPYVIRHIVTGDFVGTWPTSSDVNAAPQYAAPGHAKSTRDFNAAVHEVIEVKVETTLLPGTEERLGEWFTEADIIEKYGDIVYGIGEDTSMDPYHYNSIVQQPPRDAPNELFQVKGKKVYQAVWLSFRYKNHPEHPGYKTHQHHPRLLQIHPVKEQTGH